MVLTLDSFWSEFQTRCVPNGWSIVEGARYNPTHVTGFTPTGRSFTLDMVEGTITLTIAGRVRTITRARSVWEPGDKTVDALIEARNLFPANQR